MYGLFVFALVSPLIAVVSFWIVSKALAGRYNKYDLCKVESVVSIGGDSYSGIINGLRLNEFSAPPALGEYLMKQRGDEELKLHYVGKGNSKKNSNTVVVYGVEKPDGTRFLPSKGDIKEMPTFVVLMGWWAAGTFLMFPFGFVTLIFGALEILPGHSWMMVAAVLGYFVAGCAAVAYKVCTFKARNLISKKHDLSVHMQPIL